MYFVGLFFFFRATIMVLPHPVVVAVVAAAAILKSENFLRVNGEGPFLAEEGEDAVEVDPDLALFRAKDPLRDVFLGLEVAKMMVIPISITSVPSLCTPKLLVVAL